MKRSTEHSPNQLSRGKKAGAIGVGLLALAASFGVGRAYEEREQNLPKLVEAEGLDHTRENIIAEQISQELPIKALNGVLIASHKDKTETIYENPIVTYNGKADNDGKVDANNFHFYTATYVEGLPVVHEIENTDAMEISGPDDMKSPLTLDVIVQPAGNYAEGSITPNTYIIKSFPEELYSMGNVKGLFPIGRAGEQVGLPQKPQMPPVPPGY